MRKWSVVRNLVPLQNAKKLSKLQWGHRTYTTLKIVSGNYTYISLIPILKTLKGALSVSKLFCDIVFVLDVL